MLLSEWHFPPPPSPTLEENSLRRVAALPSWFISILHRVGDFFRTQSLLTIEGLYSLQREIKSGSSTSLEINTFYDISTPMWQSLEMHALSVLLSDLFLLLKIKGCIPVLSNEAWKLNEQRTVWSSISHSTEGSVQHVRSQKMPRAHQRKNL